MACDRHCFGILILDHFGFFSRHSFWFFFSCFLHDFNQWKSVRWLYCLLSFLTLSLSRSPTFFYLSFCFSTPSIGQTHFLFASCCHCRYMIIWINTFFRSFFFNASNFIHTTVIYMTGWLYWVIFTFYSSHWVILQATDHFIFWSWPSRWYLYNNQSPENN